MTEIGFVRLESDPCCWVLFDDSDGTTAVDEDVANRAARARHYNVVAIVCAHVDDFMFAGREWTHVGSMHENSFKKLLPGRSGKAEASYNAT